MTALTLRPCAGEPELSDPALTGEFAEEMARISREAQVPPWCGYVAWEGEIPVGFGGLKGPPDKGDVAEIGYLTFPRHVGRGIATIVAHELSAIAAAAGARAVIAHTLPEENASTRVLVKAGFSRDGWGEDEDVGRVWRWRWTA